MTERGGRRHRESGVTLVGLMVGLAVGSLVLSATLQAYLLISEGARDTLRLARLDQELRAALDLMRTDIRRAGHWDFADLDHDSDANGDGRFDWSDLGLDALGRGQFDTDVDGDTDDLDLAPVNNPFQGRFGSVNNDLCVETETASGACAATRCIQSHPSGDCLSWIQEGGCLTYSYDLDADGRIGIRACDTDEQEEDCPRPGGAPFDASADQPYAWRSWYPPARPKPSKAIEMEMFGFRFRKGGIEMRVGRQGQNDTGFGCDSGRWERITSADIRVTELRFVVTTATRNANADKAPTDPCQSGDPCQEVRSVAIALAGQLFDDATSTRRLSTQVAVRNDRHLLMP